MAVLGGPLLLRMGKSLKERSLVLQVQLILQEKHGKACKIQMLTEIPEIVSSQPSVVARASMGVTSTGSQWSANRSGTRNLQQELKFMD